MSEPKEGSTASEPAEQTPAPKNPAEKNPWYVLATIAGEQSGKVPGLKLHEKNRQYWNAWASQHLNDEEKAAIKDAKGDPILEDTPAWSEVAAEVTEAFSKRLPEVDLPDPANEVYFMYVTFSKPVSFERFHFHARANFDSATFSGDAYFNSATFSKPAKFIETEFSLRADFTDASFDTPCNFREAKFHTAYPNLEGTLLHPKTNFTVKPDFWPPTDKQNPDPNKKSRPQTDEDASQSCAHLRQNMAAQGLPDAAHFFFRREMTHKARIARWWERPIYALYRAVEYGYGVWQPIAGIIMTLALGWFVLLYWGAMSGRVAFGLSVSNTFRFLGFQRVYFEPGLIKSLSFWLEVMTGTQTVLGFVLLFLLGLGLRNRFRLK